MAVPQLLIDHLTAAVKDVFQIMVFRDVDHAGPSAVDMTSGPRKHVVASVAFTGERCGVVSILSTFDTARGITGSMLGMPASEVNGEMPDAIGEVANMIAGTFRTKMAAFEPAWAISLPTVTIGSDFITEYAAPVTRVTLPFDLDGERVVIELVLEN